MPHFSSLGVSLDREGGTPAGDGAGVGVNVVAALPDGSDLAAGGAPSCVLHATAVSSDARTTNAMVFFI
jgi:hypothetical protein